MCCLAVLSLEPSITQKQGESPGGDLSPAKQFLEKLQKTWKYMK